MSDLHSWGKKAKRGFFLNQIQWCKNDLQHFGQICDSGQYELKWLGLTLSAMQIRKARELPIIAVIIRVTAPV